MKRLIVLGVTGSVGRRTLELAEHFPDEFRVEGMAARGSNPELLVELCRRHRPRALALADASVIDTVARALGSPCPELLAGPAGIVTLAGEVEADVVLSAIVGGAGLLPTMAAIKSGKSIALFLNFSSHGPENLPNHTQCRYLICISHQPLRIRWRLAICRVL